MTILTRNYEYRLRTNKAFVSRCEQVLQECRWLYNQSLAEWKNAYRYRQGVRPDKLAHIVEVAQHTSAYDQEKAVTLGRATGALDSTINRSIQCDVLDRRQKASQAFFRRLKAGETPGYPRFKSKDRFSSFAVTIDPRHRSPLQNNKLTIPSVGTVRVRLSRSLPEGAVIKQVRIVRRADGWYAVLALQFVHLPPPPVNDEVVGIDVGIAHLFALSTGETAPNPRYGEAAQTQLTARSQKLAKKPKRKSKRRDQTKKLVAKSHLKTVRQRAQRQCELVKWLVSKFGVFAIEDLKIRNMVRNHHLARVISDVAWGGLIAKLICKAAEAGGRVIKVNPRHTSQMCSTCGQVDAANRVTQALFLCQACGHSENADINAAKNIRSRGLGILLREGANKQTEGVGRNEHHDDASCRLSLA